MMVNESIVCCSEEAVEAPVIKARKFLRNVLSNVPARGEKWPVLCHTLSGETWLVLCHTLNGERWPVLCHVEC